MTCVTRQDNGAAVVIRGRPVRERNACISVSLGLNRAVLIKAP